MPPEVVVERSTDAYDPDTDRVLRCATCGKVKPAREFYRRKRGSFQRQSSCKVCDCARGTLRFTARYATDPDFREAQKDYKRRKWRAEHAGRPRLRHNRTWAGDPAERFFCARCRAWKPAAEFHKRATHPDGTATLYSYCGPCKRKENVEYDRFKRIARANGLA